jgi:hypothetical protein
VSGSFGQALDSACGVEANGSGAFSIRAPLYRGAWSFATESRDLGRRSCGIRRMTAAYVAATVSVAMTTPIVSSEDPT